MRRKEKEIPKRSEIEVIIGKSIVCRVGMAMDYMPYVVPMN